jgi:hypothetical protein
MLDAASSDTTIPKTVLYLLEVMLRTNWTRFATNGGYQ